MDINMQNTRRQFLGTAGAGIGGAALSSLLQSELQAGNKASIGTKEGFKNLTNPHHAPKVKRVIYLMQTGAPSHLDLFQHKPFLTNRRGEEIPESVRAGQRLSTMTANAKSFPVIPSIKPFKRYGKSGMMLSEMLPHTGSIADEICLVNSMHTEAVNHAPATTLFLTGHQLPGRPSLGAWSGYGLGSENDNLPKFVVMTSVDRQLSCGQLFYDYYWGSGFIPSKYQGVKFRGEGDPVLYLSNPKGISKTLRRRITHQIGKMNQHHYDHFNDPEIKTRISQYEMAYRMQTSVPELADISKEPQHVLDLYGPDVQRPGSFARNCILARKLAERGVSFIQLMHAGWDQHQNLPTQLEIQCKDTDQPSAGLVKDLKQRGLLEDTLVIWGGEFGRTPFGQGDIKNKKKHGRDHHGGCFSLWMAGGGVKKGQVYGKSDDYAFNITENPVHVHDFQATVLHLMGIDHTRLTYRYQGRNFRLTDVHGHVVKDILT